MELGLTNTGGTNMLVYFNVNFPVGPKCMNQSDDVMLVQYFLQKLGKGGNPTDQPEMAKKYASIEPNGIFDSLTAECIRSFQGRFGTSVQDGIVSPARNASMTGFKYTIWMLNFLVRLQFPKTWPRVQDAPDCPPNLKTMAEAIL